MAEAFKREIREDGKVVLVNYTNNDIEVVIPEDIDIIGPRVFFSASKMETLVLNDRVCEIPVDSFCYNISFTNFSVPESNPFFSERDGLLYTKDGKTLLNYPPARKAESYEIEEGVTSMRQSFRYGPRFLFEITTPSTFAELPDDAFRCSFTVRKVKIKDNVRRIGKRCFSFSTDLESIALPSTLEEIDEEAFRGLTSLSEIEIPESVKKIAPRAFVGCPLLKSVKISSTCEIAPDSFDSSVIVERY
ncbi:MAG: leucine-rich repeat domain-containing protein [Sphaerochaetaceae bacterium]|nr:leucine-rich repeat domain-containing protein [Sphaerochaetaceae bacterium]